MLLIPKTNPPFPLSPSTPNSHSSRKTSQPPPPPCLLLPLPSSRPPAREATRTYTHNTRHYTRVGTLTPRRLQLPLGRAKRRAGAATTGPRVRWPRPLSFPCCFLCRLSSPLFPFSCWRMLAHSDPCSSRLFPLRFWTAPKKNLLHSVHLQCDPVYMQSSSSAAYVQLHCAVPAVFRFDAMIGLLSLLYWLPFFF